MAQFRTTTPPAGRAFTLLEVLLVLLLIGILAAVVWPDFSAASRSEQLFESSRRLKGLVAMCRAQAMNESRRYRIYFQPDGTVAVGRQLDPITAPEQYVAMTEPWARMNFLLDNVWIHAILPLPDGPAPILVDDKKIQFTQDLLGIPKPIASLETPALLDFEPDGSSDSALWELRDVQGRGLKMTLDGRLGRMAIEPLAVLSPDELRKPAKIADDKKLLPADPATLRDKKKNA